MKFYLYLALTTLFMLLAIPSLLFGFKLAQMYNLMVLVPIPAMFCCVGIALFGHKLEQCA
jgi:hypothetical protein